MGKRSVKPSLRHGRFDSYYSHAYPSMMMTIYDVLKKFSQCEFCGYAVLSHEEANELGQKFRTHYFDYCSGYQYMQEDPFAQEIHDDHTLFLMCDGEAHQSSMEI